MHDRGEHITPSSAHEGERVILEGRKRDRIRNQVLARFLTRARSYARERACKLASAPIMRWYTCARERLCLRQCCTRARGAKSLADEHSMIKRSRTDAVLVTSLEINEYLGLRPAYRIQMTSWWWHRVQISVEIHLNEQTQERFHLDRKVRRYFDWVNVRWVNKAIKTAMWFHSTWMRCVLKRNRSWGFYAFQYSVCDENKERENEISYAFA